MATALAEKPRIVVQWRFDSLRKAGYDEREALEIAMRADIDLHLAVRLLRLGCDQGTALRILR
jgi:alkylhydroperoxidase family enzyme